MDHIIFLYGPESHTSAWSIGKAIQAVDAGKKVIMVQYLKNQSQLSDIRQRLEPELKIFYFEKKRIQADQLTQSEKKDLHLEIQNAFNFTKKILDTGECDLLILDGIFDAIGHAFIQAGDFQHILEKLPAEMDLICTGKKENADIDNAHFEHKKIVIT